jgi:hypothetical protein
MMTLKDLEGTAHNLIDVHFSELFGGTGENDGKPVMIGDVPVEIRKDNLLNPSQVPHFQINLFGKWSLNTRSLQR